MTDTGEPTLGSWAKRYYYANRAAVDAVLRTHGIGSTQWAVLYELAGNGTMAQSELGRALHLERASLSGIVTTLVRKGLVEQSPSPRDQRQRLLTLTAAGHDLWNAVPDPFADVRAVALDGIDPAELATAIRVLRQATTTLDNHAF